MIHEKWKTVNQIYDDFVKRTPKDKAVLYFEKRAITAGELMDRVDCFVRGLFSLGCGPGTFVGYTMPNCPDLFSLFLAVSRIGGCCVPLFHMVPDGAKVTFFSKARVSLVVTTAAQLGSLMTAAGPGGLSFATIDANNSDIPVLGDVGAGGPGTSLPEVTEDQPVLMGSSSGTTGVPKPVLLSQANIATEIRTAAFMAFPREGTVKEDYTAAMAFPLSTSGIITVSGYLLGGFRQIYSSDISPLKFMEVISFWKADAIVAPPAYLEGILTLPELKHLDWTTVKAIATGMDFLSPSLLERLKKRFVNFKAYTNGYGLVETSNVFMVTKNLIEEKVNPSTLTLVYPAINTIKVLDDQGRSVSPGEEGELYIKGANVIKGYLGPPELSAPAFQEGWFRTGDIVRNEGNNRITLLGRKKYLIKRGGKSVSPIVVKDLINKIPGVVDSAVVGVPHQLYGEMIWAFIVRSGELTLKEIMRHCRGELPNYMVPDSITFIETIPKNSGVGKIDFEKLKEMAAEELLSMEGQNG